MPAKPSRTDERKPRQRRKEARPAELAAAALELFVEKGYAATRLDDVARKAGVAKGTVYLYFANKEALFDGVIRQAILPLLERGEKRLDRHHGETSELLRDTLEQWMRSLSEGPLARIPKMMVTDADKFPELSQVFHDAVIARGRKLLARVIARGIARGEFRKVDVDGVVEVLVSAMWMQAIARHSGGYHAGSGPNPQSYLHALVDVLFQGLEARPDVRSELATSRRRKK